MEKVEAAKHKAKELKEELDQTKVNCAHWKDKAADIQRLLRKTKARKYRGPRAIHKAVRPMIAILVNTRE